MSNTVRDFSDSGAGSRRGIIDARRCHQSLWLVSLKDFRSKGIHGGVEVAQYLASNDMPRKARSNLYFLIRPSLVKPTYYEQAHSSFVPLAAAAVAVTTQYAAVAYRSPPSNTIVLWKALYQPGEGGAAPYRPLSSVLYSRGGAVLYRPLCSVLYSREGTPLYRPLCSDLYCRGGTPLYCPLCSVYTTGGDNSLPSLVIDII